MNRKFSRFYAILLAVLLCASVMPQNAAADETTTTEHFAFGMEYDWSDMDTDFETMTGLPLDEILGDIMQSASDAGIELAIYEELTGTSSMIIDQYEDGTTMLDYNGASVEVTKHVTELTVRHGSVADMAIITEWSDAWAGWDITISGSAEGVFNIDAFYVEYRDADDLLYGHDLEMSMEADQTGQALAAPNQAWWLFMRTMYLFRILMLQVLTFCLTIQRTAIQQMTPGPVGR